MAPRTACTKWSGGYESCTESVGRSEGGSGENRHFEEGFRKPQHSHSIAVMDGKSGWQMNVIGNRTRDPRLEKPVDPD